MADLTTTTTQKKPNAADYEPIPDVENGTGTAPSTNDYSGFDPKQIELLSNIDETIQSNGSFQFALPTVNSDDMITQGQSMIQSMVLPTLTTIVATITAFGLSAVQQLTDKSTSIDHTISTISILLFPYVNATIAFLASFRPIQSRCMTSVEPIFQKMDSIQDTIQSSISDISTNVNTTIDTVETKIKDAMEPVLPTLQTATQYESMIRTVQPDVDIPDATDIDREINETRTIVTNPLQEATTQITNLTEATKMIPYPFQSSTSFYWSIVVPIAIVCLCTQLGVVYFTTTNTTAVTTTDTVGPVSSLTGNVTSQLRGKWNDVSSTIPNDIAVSTSSKTPMTMLNIASSIVAIPSVSGDEVKNDVTDIVGSDALIESVSNMTTNELTSTKEELLAQKDTLTNEMNSTLSNMKDELHTYEAEFQGQIHNVQDEIKDFESNIDTEVSNAIGPAKSMIKSVLISYFISLLQLGLVFLMTSPKVKAYIMNLVMQRASQQVDDTLRSTGVPDAMNDIFNVRFARIRTKLMQLFTSVQKINTYLEKLGLTNSDGSNGRSPVAALADTAKSLTSRFGFGK
jgi:hypothetical protein